MLHVRVAEVEHEAVATTGRRVRRGKVHALSVTLKEVNAENVRNSLFDVNAEALVNALRDTLAEVQAKGISDTVS